VNRFREPSITGPKVHDTFEPVALAPTAALSASGVAENDGTWISWRSYGEGEPVLMIMGFMGSSRAWFRLLPHVADQHRAIVFDNRGTGDSDRPGGLFTMDHLVDDALAVLDAAGEETAHVVGVSMGGMVAQHLALDHPERVRSLSLLCTHHGGRRPGGMPWRMLASIALRPVLGPGGTFRIVAPLLYSERTRTERRERLEADLRMRAQEVTPARTALGQGAAITRHASADRLGELSMPVLVVHGEEDRLVPVEAAHELARLIPSADLRIVPNAGHLLGTDAEQETAGAVLGHIDSSG
jgi:pimeloyl-ACP methyl ester carboxylesterase